ncbi:MAG TPA: hypothetical protein VER96_38370 [Polyangiaceae bacterium]|nr:hypothetical protein [Polyangiaceae bacterium]
MLLVILEHVDERIANLPWAFQSSAMPAIGPEAATAPQDAVHAAGDAHHEPAHTSGKSRGIFRLYEQVDMTVLN